LAIDFEKLRPKFQKAAKDMPFREGWDWCELSPEEADVFKVDPDRWTLMLTAYDCFAGLMGASDNDWYDMREPDIDTSSGYFDPRKFNAEDFMTFGKEMGLTHREAFTVWHKVEWWQMRNGVMVFKDERELQEQREAMREPVKSIKSAGFDDMDDGIPI
jgi:hypothetical protein